MSLKIPPEKLIELPPAKFPLELQRVAQSSEFKDEIFSKRQQVQGFTIDGASSRDLDDAIWLEKRSDSYLVQVSISDVDELVKAHTELDQEALNRTSTIYYPDRNIPMLPRVLSENRLSLLEGKPRPTLTVSIEINHDLQIKDIKLEKTYLISAKRLSHSDFLPHHSIGPNALKALEYYNLARALNHKRQSEQSLAFQQFPGTISTDEEGNPTAELPTHGHMVVQEFMILANQAVAKLFADQNLAAPFRNHLQLNGHAPTRSEIISLIESEEDYLQLVDKLRELYNQFLCKAAYETNPRGHFGLNLASYLHFTSPIRRYADLINHRIAKALIGEEKPPYSFQDIDHLCRHLNSRALRILTLRSQYQPPNSLQKYQQNSHFLVIDQPLSSKDNLFRLQSYLVRKRMSNVHFEFSFNEGLNLLLTCKAWVNSQKDRIEVIVSAQTDKQTIQEKAAQKLYKKIQDLVRSSPELFSSSGGNEQKKINQYMPGKTEIARLQQYCHRSNLQRPFFHTESWCGNNNITTSICRLGLDFEESGTGNSFHQAEETAAAKMLKKLQESRLSIPPNYSESIKPTESQFTEEE